MGAKTSKQALNEEMLPSSGTPTPFKHTYLSISFLKPKLYFQRVPSVAPGYRSRISIVYVKTGPSDLPDVTTGDTLNGFILNVVLGCTEICLSSEI
jgi:hypothetical protein